MPFSMPTTLFKSALEVRDLYDELDRRWKSNNIAFADLLATIQEAGTSYLYGERYFATVEAAE